MSNQNADQEDPIVVAQRAERDLNSTQAKNPRFDAPGSAGQADSTEESGVDTNVEQKFPGATVTYGSAASGAGDNREIPDEEGGGINPNTGRQTKARDFEGVGGPEDKADVSEVVRGGDSDAQANVRS